MQHRTLGRTGVQVSTLVLGAMNFGSLGRTTQDEVTAMADDALEGINLIDTADMYSRGESEEMVGGGLGLGGDECTDEGPITPPSVHSSTAPAAGMATGGAAGVHEAAGATGKRKYPRPSPTPSPGATTGTGRAFHPC